MILVLLGTQDKSFSRLLDAIQKQINIGNIKDKVVVQAGCTTYKSNNMKIFDLISNKELEKLIDEANLIITHGGVGSIIGGISKGKIVIAAARLKKYGEHTNDHQLQIIKKFSDMGCILELKKFDKLDKVLEKAKKFKPKKYDSNTNKFIKLIEDYIDNN